MRQRHQVKLPLAVTKLKAIKVEIYFGLAQFLVHEIRKVYQSIQITSINLHFHQILGPNFLNINRHV